MTDHIDYTQKPEVLVACDVEIVKVPPRELGLPEFLCKQTRYRFKNYYGDAIPVLTMQELWEGLCKACKEAGHRWNPEISGLAAVLVNPNDTDGRGFVSSEYGSLTNAIAAALHWVLQQKEP